MAEAGCIDDDTTGGGRVITEFASISAGGNHTCGVGTDGYVGCWGEDWNGSTQPPDGEFSFVAAGWTHTCGVRAGRLRRLLGRWAMMRKRPCRLEGSSSPSAPGSSTHLRSEDRRLRRLLGGR